MTTALVYPLRRRNPGQIGSLVLDATLNENHDYSAEVTSDVVEGGAKKSDHISLDPELVTMTGLVTDTPHTGFDATRSDSALQELRSLFNARETVTLVTNLLVYADMAFTRLQFGKNAQTGRALRFVAEFKKIDSAESATVDVPAEKLAPVAAAGDPAGTNQDQGSSTQTIGKQTTPPADEAEEEKASILYRIIN